MLSLSSFGMFASGILLSIKAIKDKHLKILSISLILAGIFMSAFGSSRILFFITLSGFIFFFMLGPIHTCLDYLIRINISNEYQGRVWSLIGFISQMGFVISYLVSGLLADYVFIPLFKGDTNLANLLVSIFGNSKSSAIGFEIFLAGIF
ncbi:hypothetical protein, partial [Rhodovulum adriaticum]|uniref:hypothetical protein n=1 Tax=Rhodovulum adriaticum TaxID=35804 RepID=UPI001A93473D